MGLVGEAAFEGDIGEGAVAVAEEVGGVADARAADELAEGASAVAAGTGGEGGAVDADGPRHGAQAERAVEAAADDGLGGEEPGGRGRWIGRLDPGE